MCKREKYEIKVTDTKIFAVYLPPQQERWSWRKWTLWTHLPPRGWAVEKDIPSELCLVFTCSCYEKPLCLLQCLKTHSFSITTQFYFYCKDKSTQQKDKLVTWTQIKGSNKCVLPPNISWSHRIRTNKKVTVRVCFKFVAWQNIPKV